MRGLYFLPDQAIKEADQILEALGEGNRSITAQIFFAQVLCWYRTGAIAKAGGVSRFEAGFRRAGDLKPIGVVASKNGAITKAHKLIRKAEDLGLLDGEVKVDPEPLFPPEPPISKQRDTPSPKSSSPQPTPKPEPKGPTLWQQFTEAYCEAAPKTWAKPSSRMQPGGLDKRLVKAAKVAGGSERLMAMVISALLNVPRFYRETYPKRDGKLRPAKDFLACLLSGESRNRDLGTEGWRLFEWAEVMDDAPPQKVIRCSWTSHDWKYQAGMSEADKLEARTLLFEAGQGPHPDRPINEMTGRRDFWGVGMDPLA